MLNIRGFIGERRTVELTNACDNVDVRPELLNQLLYEEILALAHDLENMSEYDIIRTVYEEKRDERNVKSHLSVIFQKKLPLISKILRDPLRGSRGIGRPRILTEAEEETVVRYIVDRQRSMRCMTFNEVTRYINEEVLANSHRKVSSSFVMENPRIMGTLEVGSPQQVEGLRIEACIYENFVNFFDRWNAALLDQEFDPDLIINVDETTSNAQKTKTSTMVLFDPNIEIRPITAVESKVEHVTLCCGVSASGKCTIPSFIIKNKTISVEDELLTDFFDHGQYAVQYSYNGWQETVSSQITI